MSEAAVLDVAALDSAATAVETDTPALDTNQAEVPVVESTEQGTDTPTTDEAKPEGKTETEADAVTAPINNTKVVEALKTLKTTDPAMAKHLYNEVKSAQDFKRVMKELAPEAKTLAEFKEALSNRVDPESEQFRQSVENSDELLYRGDLKELTNNILEDISAELGDTAPARLSELSEALLEKITEADPAGATRIQRAQFLAASESSGLINSLNRLNGFLQSGDVKSSSSLLQAIGTFFGDEQKANSDVAKSRTEAAAKATQASTAAVTALRTEATSEVSKTTNEVMGAFLRPFLSAQLKGMDRPALIKAAQEIKADLDRALTNDEGWKKIAEEKWKALTTPASKREIMRLYTEKLKSGLGAKVIESTLKRMFPEKFKAPAPKPAAPASTQITIGGKSQTVFQLAKRPTNLVRTDTEVAGRVYTSKDLQLLQLSKGIGLVPNKSGKGHSFVQWKR